MEAPRRETRKAGLLAQRRPKLNGEVGLKTLAKALVGVVPILILLAPTPAFATAWGAWVYEISVHTQAYGWTDYCDRAGIVDTASNRIDMQTRANTAGCSGAAKNVPSGYLGGKVAGYRNGAYCGTSSAAYSSTVTWGFLVYANMCSNPSGSQTFSTIGYGAIYNDGSAGGSVGYIWNNESSPNQNY